MFERAFAGEVITEVETVRLHRDGTRVAVTVSWSPIKDDAGAITGVSVIARDLTPTASIGIAIAAGEDAETVLRNADTAMYAAKRQGKRRHALFEPAMHATVVERLDLAADLSRAVERKASCTCATSHRSA